MKRGIFLVLGLLFLSLVEAKEIEVIAPSGQFFSIDVEDSDTFFEVTNRIWDVVDPKHDKELIFSLNACGKAEIAARDSLPIILAGNQGGDLGFPRDYYAPLTDAQKDAIHFIVTTLGFESIWTILKNKARLESHGDSVDTVHPYNFIHFICSDPQRMAALRNVRTRGTVWKDFGSGIKGSLDTEMKRKNLLMHTHDFATRLNLAHKFVDLQELVENENWDKFIDSIIALMPKSKDFDRYNGKAAYHK